MAYIPGNILGGDKAKIGKSFPVSPNVDEKLDNDVLSAIYIEACKHYENGDWSIGDFKKFRSEVSSCSVDTFFDYAEVILYLMSLPSYQTKLLVLGLDLDYDLHIFDERKKIQTIDPENNRVIRECYEIIRNDYNASHIVSVSKALHHRILSLQARFLEQRYPEYKGVPTPEAKKEILLSILENGLSDGGKDIEYLYQEFDKNFKKLEDLPIKNYIVSQREKLVPLTIQTIYQYISSNEFKIRRSYDNYVGEQSSAAFFKSLKGKGRRFGQWSHD